MDWIDDVWNRIKRENQVLFAKNDMFLQDLVLLIEEQNHRTMVLWALELADEAAMRLGERYPDDGRPREAVETAWAWATGRVKMPVAQRAILRAHGMAKDIGSPVDIALCHAVGQACGVVHTAGHAIGFPMYELTALVRHYGIDTCKEPAEERKAHYVERLLYWQVHHADRPREWAGFLLADPGT